MSNIKLTYFDMDGGRADPARIALSIAGIEFEDNLIAFSDMAELKSTLPLGSVPVIEIDGEIYTQGNAMARYFGKLAGLYPDDPWQAFLCDEAIYIVDDAASSIGSTMGLQGDELKTAREKIASGIITASFKLLSKRLQAAGGEFFANNKLSIADLVVFGFVKIISKGVMDHLPTDLVEKEAPLLVEHMERVNKDPRIVSYYQKGSQ